jgi:transcriptional/translational regulatory protein YebC/TACO1
MEPDNRIELNLEDAEKFMKLIDRLEDLDDTQEVYHNADISNEVMAQL